MRLLPLTLALVACQGGSLKTDDTATDTEDSAPVEEEWPEGLAELTEPSSGVCPDLSASATVTFTSSGEERRLTAVIPSDPGEDMGVVFFFHGLMSPQQTPNPTEYMADGLDLQSLADANNTILLLPESPTRTEFGQTFFLWDVEGVSDHDLVLVDDLRSCVAQSWDVDLTRVSALGFSGGALFTTIVASQRADSLSTFVEMSGGADFETFLSENLIAAYSTPAWDIPALLFSGGANDAWPDPNFAIIQFDTGTDTLTRRLAEDGHFVVRCRHNMGHTLTNQEYALATEWLLAHRFGEPSPYVATGIASFGDWCEIGEAGGE